MGCRKSSSYGEIHSDTCLPQKEKKRINLTYHLKELEKGEPTKPKVGRREEIIKIQEEINKIEVKKTTEKNQ